ncbi:receptor activity-modifying protein 2 isoform X2 [Lampris incognitus]|uniref:receptor activity-modifying protein 2 isoform X2 n=1 Tax=Lampris incognitus TaxID=2546036 RepID=UPI0024B54E2E|nr:receptor activity-modifying protein 2 isoform X2 [Lampris incognitus]
MRASCCFIEPSCKKVEICNLYPPGKSERTMSGKMTSINSSPVASWGFVAFLLWVGGTMVVGLVSEELGDFSATTLGYHFTKAVDKMTNTSYGDFPRVHDCGNNSLRCEFFCNFCASEARPTIHCLNRLFEEACVTPFKDIMTSLNNTDWCVWKNVVSAYNIFTLCTEEISECLLIPWPNPLVEQTFVEIHAMYFQDCPTEELSDPPPGIVFALVMTPICLIPVMVVLVVLKTKNGDGSS